MTGQLRKCLPAGSERKVGGALPLAPTPQKSKDPFAILAADSPHAALAPKPQSPLKSVAAAQSKSSTTASFDPFAFPTPPASAGNSSAGKRQSLSVLSNDESACLTESKVATEA